MCRRCLRSVDEDTLIVPDYASSIACTEDGDDASLVDMLQNSSQNIYLAAATAAASGVSTQVSKIMHLAKYFGSLTMPLILHCVYTILYDD